MRDQATSFGAAADVYDRARPGYPPDAVEWMLQSAPREIVDVGAGTGKFTRLIAGRATVTAVEPDPAMLAKIDLPAERKLVGTAERIPLPDDSADLIVAAQAWHWVDPALAVPEAARVLRPGGWLAMIWNARDHRDPWVARFRTVVEDSPAEQVASRAPALGAAFGPVGTFETTWTKDFTREGVLELVQSRSMFITSSPADKTATLEAVTALLDETPGDRIPMAYRTHCYRAQLLGR